MSVCLFIIFNTFFYLRVFVCVFVCSLVLLSIFLSVYYARPFSIFVPLFTVFFFFIYMFVCLLYNTLFFLCVFVRVFVLNAVVSLLDVRDALWQRTPLRLGKQGHQDACQDARDPETHTGGPPCVATLRRGRVGVKMRYR